MSDLPLTAQERAAAEVDAELRGRKPVPVPQLLTPSQMAAYVRRPDPDAPPPPVAAPNPAFAGVMTPEEPVAVQQAKRITAAASAARALNTPGLDLSSPPPKVEPAPPPDLAYKAPNPVEVANQKFGEGAAVANELRIRNSRPSPKLLKQAAETVQQSAELQQQGDRQLLGGAENLAKAGEEIDARRASLGKQLQPVEQQYKQDMSDFAARDKDLDGRIDRILKSDLSIDPKRSQRKSVAENIFKAIGLALGSFGGAVSGGKNYAASAIDDEINRDIAVQKADIEKQLAKVAELRGAKSGAAAQLKMKLDGLGDQRAAMYEIAKNDLERIAAKTGSTSIRDKAQQTLTELEQSRLAARQQAIGSMIKASTSNAATKFAQEHAKGALKSDKDAEDTFKKSSAQQLAKANVEAKTAPAGTDLLRGYAHDGGRVPDNIEMRKLRDATAASLGAVAQAQHTRGLLKTAGAIDRVSLGGVGTGKYKQVQSALADVTKTSTLALRGVASDKDTAMIKTAIGTKGKLLDMLTDDRGLDEFIGALKRVQNKQAAQYGFAPLPDSPFQEAAKSAKER